MKWHTLVSEWSYLKRGNDSNMTHWIATSFLGFMVVLAEGTFHYLRQEATCNVEHKTSSFLILN